MTFYKEIYTNIHRQRIEEFIKRDVSLHLAQQRKREKMGYVE